MKYILTTMALALGLGACVKDLDRFPVNDVTSEQVYASFEGTEQAFAKVYGALTLTGQVGPAGNPDISGLDEGGNADFLRSWFNHQEMPTDETHCKWSDPGIDEMNVINFISNGSFTIGLYNKCITQVMYANDFLRNTAGRDYGDKQAEVNYFRGESRFLRAFSYWVMLDTFGRSPFVTEDHALGILPEPIERPELFEYVESELLDLVNTKALKEPKQNEYGRVDMAAAYALLARLYLNAEVYTGTARWTDAITYSKKVIAADYSLMSNYEHLFLSDNNKNNPEIIFPLTFDGKNTRSYGGTTFLVNATSYSTYQEKYADKLIHYGIFDNANWAGYRARKQFTDLFDRTDKRFLFVGENNALGSNPSATENGLHTYKWRNITSSSTPESVIYGSDPAYADIDFPLFRLAEHYLILAEAVARGGTGATRSEAATYLNLLRVRAFGEGTDKFFSSDYTARDVLDERARELYYECFRRTDLIRFGLFTSSDYVWEWKGGTQDGRQVDSKHNLFPIPSTDAAANPNLGVGK